ncbi:uncharacterized protein F5891DRAFT_1041594 [Suillus fuscotomentosus]|uniref:Uncharacterized protein n=1 Tax=Suillus fuscotomentosus TaxID=1912939 RepID=A0AAD4E357_9AGAM|nr:uncharacterized protein F5891DRAFT_1041594 [Suillus fuscotomentosus]KAG1898868.1 hypothetical protein F5891DRAFT_1041594 [Suillus fuscotomentosus]
MANVALCMLFILYSVVTASDLTATQAKLLYCLSGFIAVCYMMFGLCISVTERG